MKQMCKNALLAVAYQTSSTSDEAQSRKGESNCSDCKEILTIETNSEQITIHSSSRVFKYSAKNLRGETVFSMIDEDQFRARRPDLHSALLGGNISAIS